MIDCELNLVLLALIPIFAYVIKGATGFGPALVIVPTFTIYFGVQFALAFSAIIDIFIGGALIVMLRPLWIHQKAAYAVLACLLVGTAIGGIAMSVLGVEWLKEMVAACSIIFGGYLLFASIRNASQIKIRMPLYPLSTVGGFTGVAAGMSGPPIVMALAASKNKGEFRDILAIVFYRTGRKNCNLPNR